jgi:curved DNA-binding protein CbpA
MTTLYDMLDIRPDDDAGTVKEAFRKAAKVSHPDLNANDPNAPTRFMEIVRANAILGDPELRAVYDRMLEFERQQHQLASATYKIFPDAVIVVVLAVVMAGAYMLYTNFPEMSAYLPRIITAKIKADADTTRATADAATVRPSPADEARVVDSPRDKVESAAAPVLGAVAATQANAVTAEDTARETGNGAQPSPPADANAASHPRDHIGLETSEPAVATPTEKNAATENAALASANSNATQPSPPPDVNAAGGPHDQRASDEAAPPVAVAAAANDGAATKDAVPALSAVAPPAIDRAVDTASSHEPPPSAPVKNAEFYRQQGIASYRNGDLPMAIADFDLAIRLDPNLEDVYIDRGIVLYRLHQSDRAFADVAQAIRIENSHQNTPPLPRARPAD